MNTYEFKTDSSSGEIQAESLKDALAKVIAEEGVTDEAISDGAWAWVEDEDGERLSTSD